MPLDWSPLSDLIARTDRFLVTSHVRPDGDALGSELGVVGLLRHFGKDVRVVNSSRMPPRYDFLDPDGKLFEHYGSISDLSTLGDRQAIIILDLSAWSQLGDMASFVRDFAGPKLVIDHHVSQDDLGATYLKDVKAEATGTLVYQAVDALGASCTPEMATGLLTAIAMDTGWFRHPNTNPQTLQTSAKLIDAGAPVAEIYRLLFERSSLGRLKMLGESLASLRTEMGGRIAYATVTRDDFERTGAIPQDTEDLVDYTVSVSGVDVGLLFIEQAKGGIKLSIRSRNGLDCAKLAGQFGGGGHKAAAGATLPDPLSEALPRVLDAVSAALTE